MKEKKLIRIGITGPESTGKTAMAEALAGAMAAAWVPEFARYYIAHLGRPYERTDLKAIGAGQRKWEEWFGASVNTAAPGHRANNLLILDTDWTVLQVWEQYRFQTDDDYEWQKGYGVAKNADLYLLCAPDFAWQPDPLREHPAERDVLFRLYENLLRERQANFITLSGEHATRLQTALAAIRKLF